MGMDVSGKAPSSEDGKYFRASVWSWRPIWTYCEAIAPALTAKVRLAHYNDGDGLNAEDSAKLGRKVLASCEDGSAAKYIAEMNTRLDALPKERCEFCDGTGTRSDAVGVINGFAARNWCNGCDGKGHRDCWDAAYRFDLEHLTEFGKFLSTCGGFEIW